jgi:Ca2+-binding RTX toxin-like protein
MTVTTVSTTAELNAALKAVHAGDTIQLNTGVYTGAVASYLSFTSDVTITSVSPGAPAVLTDLKISNSSGITVRDLEFRVDPAGVDNPFTVSRSSDITLARLNIHGSMDGSPQDDRAAMLVRDSTDVTVSNSTFQQLWIGLGHLNNSGLTITGNTFKGIDMDGVRGGGSSYVTISRNTFTDFHPRTGEHPDAIQFWTTGTTTAAHDITITENIMLRGAGTGTIPQGIFLADEVGTLPYQHVTISGNLLAGMGYNGLAVMHGQDVKVDGNMAVGFTDYKSWIRLENLDGGVISNNKTTLLVTTPTDVHLDITGNTTVAQVSDGGAAYLAEWHALHDSPPPGPTPTISGTPNADVLNGTASVDVIAGGAGNDTLNGLAGNDTVQGGDGDDKLLGGVGADVLDGGAGNDYYIVDNVGDVVLETQAGAAGGVDTVASGVSFTLGANVEKLMLSAGALNGTGNALDNWLKGGAGDNILKGLGGADELTGLDGADTLIGGAGADTLTGGTGVDKFVFAVGDGKDVIKDFGAGGEHDAIDVSAFYSAGQVATLAQTAAGVTITFTGGDSIVVTGGHLADLHATASGWVF